MKKIFWLLGLIITGCISCNKSLDQTPKTSITDKDFWKSSSDLELYCNNLYNAILSPFGNTNYGNSNLAIYGWDAFEGSDNMIAMNYSSNMNGERVVPASGGGWNWTTLRNINYFLANYSRSTDPWDAVKPYVGEALFFRSWFYFDKLKNFGDLPWINTVLSVDSEELFNERLKRNIIVDSMMSDLDRAVEYLPSKAAAGASRITKEIAMLFQARIALYEGTWEKYHYGTPFGVVNEDGSKFIRRAAEVSKALIQSGTHALDNTDDQQAGYWRLFNQVNYTGSKEIMLWRQYDVDLGIIHAVSRARFTNRGAGIGLTKNLVDNYLCIDGLPPSLSPLYQSDNTLTSVAADRDPRLRQTIYLPGHVITNNQPGGAADILFTIPHFEEEAGNRPASGYVLYKGHNPDANQQNSITAGTTATVIFRYAEALLIFAEAKAELSEITQDDLDISVNVLRDRVQMPHLLLANIVTDPNWDFPGLSPVINEVRRERRIELACEGHRHDDVFRWAAAGDLIAGWKPKGAKRDQWEGIVPENILVAYPEDAQGYIELYKNALPNGYQFDETRDYLFPIPQTEIVLNPKIKQNPGWPN